MSERDRTETRDRQRLGVFKTYKLYIGGKFPRSESGRVYQVTTGSTASGAAGEGGGEWLANAPRASRKDARDAVVAARKAFGGWSGATAYNRGQILYRIAEMLQGRHEQFAAEVAEAEGVSRARAAAQVDAAIDRWVWYAGWTDKIAQVAGGGNPVAGPFFNLSSPEPTGVVAVLAPQDSALLGLVSVLAPVIATGNTAVVVAAERCPLPALSLSEVLATSDLPGGVVNMLSGRTAEIAAPLAAHQDVNAIDLTGADAGLAQELEVAAADNLKRVLRPRPADTARDWTADPGIHRLTAFLETKTVWHPTGSLGASGSAY
ncbi:aldehyde dehydrogenase family protein [Streptomyces sp. NPDC058045]|uniref:aldehyde dehydrogenase family protein n=1 Tax=Streptomyces sp. NPDC058045 TaxID=3346311 RepID=UPI0036EA77F6